MASGSTRNALVEFLKRIESHYPSSTLGAERWYLIALSVFTSTGNCNLVADLYIYLISLPQNSTPVARQDLTKRIREALMKLTAIIGVARPLEVIIHLNDVTAPEDRDYSFSRRGWRNNEENRTRGENWLRKLYSAQYNGTYEMFDSHKDFGWISSDITYGLYLSDHRILNGVETELCVLSGMFCLGLPRMMGWHLRAFRRIGVSSEDCEKVQQCIEMCAEHLGVQVENMPRVHDIEHEVCPLEAGGAPLNS